MDLFLIRLLECTLTMSLPVLALLILTPLMNRRYSPRGIYGAWLVLLLGLLLPWRFHATAPAVTMTVPPLRNAALPMPVEALPAIGEQATAIPSLEAALQKANATPLLTWPQALFLVWALGFAVTLLVHLYKHFRFMQVVNRWTKPIPRERYLSALRHAKSTLGIRRNVALYLCPPVDSPMLVGLVRPRILLPDMEFNDEELQMVFAHELIHLKRRDLWIKMAMLLATAVHWFNPLIYRMNRSLFLYQEASCDASVTKDADLATRRFYSETIISIIRRQTRLQTMLSTSFYGGKSGMKQRILSIMDGRGKKLGMAVVSFIVMLTVGCGMAFAISYLPEQAAGTLGAGSRAYIHRPDRAGAPVLSVPSVNDLEIPLAIYYNGAQVSIMELRSSSYLPEWNSKDGENNWARVVIGRDSKMDGFSGFIPLYYLSETSMDALPKAQIITDSPTAFANLYDSNEETALVTDAIKSGTEVMLLGRINKWYHVSVGGKLGYIKKENIRLDEATNVALEAALPDRFDDITKDRLDSIYTFDELVAKKMAELGLPLEDWPLEDKAWFGQLEETYFGSHDHYYMMPAEGDLPQEEAIRIAWETFTKDMEPSTVKLEDYKVTLGFFAIPERDPNAKMWSVRIGREAYPVSYEVVVSSPGGKVLEKSDAAQYKALEETEGNQTRAANARKEWEAQKGMYAYWSVEDKAQFSALYMDGSLGVPDSNAMSMEKAVDLAKAELKDKFKAPQTDLDGWKTGLAYNIAEPGNPCWIVTFHDDKDNYLTKVTINAYTGQVLSSENPYLEGNG